MRGHINIIFKPPMWTVMILSPSCFCTHVFLAVWWFSGVRCWLLAQEGPKI